VNPAIRKTLVYFFFLGLAAVLMYFLYRNVSWKEDVLPGLKSAHWGLIALSFALGYFATVLRGLRWNVMLEPLGYRAPEWTNIHSVAFGYCMNNLVPRSGELARCTLLNRVERIPVDKLIGTVILERVVDLILLAVILLLAFVLNADALAQLLHGGSAEEDASQGSPAFLWIVLAAGLVALFTGIWILRKFSHIGLVKKVNHFLLGIWTGLKSVVRIRRKGLFALYSVGIWATWVLMTFCIMQALESTRSMGLDDTIFFMGAGSLGMIVPTPGGAGAFHGMSELAFAALGYDRKVGKIFALISWTAKTTFDILVGAVGFFLVTFRYKRNT
jgi:glycosyltransferase 2 family protein